MGALTLQQKQQLAVWVKKDCVLAFLPSESAISRVLRMKDQLQGTRAEVCRVRVGVQALAAVKEGMIYAMARKFLAALGASGRIKLSTGWLSKFKRRHIMRSFRLHGEEASADADAATKSQESLLMVADQYRPEDVFNTDETGLVWIKLSTRTLSTAARPGRKQSKQRITVLVTASATGTEKLPLLYIGHAVRLQCFKGLQPNEEGFEYCSKKSAWMKLALFEEWLGKFNERMVEQQRHILLQLENVSVHKTGRTFSNVRLHFLPPNTPSKIQPNGAGIIANLKHHYEIG
ncbi:TPA: hypothetical protein N0F65_005708 [Lagenidium giganteum]|uniref:HTH CENPB-type domain-containing protein n=1 Tax=Lagenidium giganteum TaxID=4803 RepID=A0AAV2ZA49_9STRA|nr:TPA: hypothetical protein N0F65_005708 [Lagenidium giganteum]